MQSFRRGFKAWCEETALQLRKELRLLPTAPLPPGRLAQHLGAVVWTPEDIEAISQEERTRLKVESWSAATIREGNRVAVIHNSANSQARQASDVMHELAHLILGHEAGHMFVAPSRVALRTHDPTQEAEASWLAGCLLLPRTVLEWVAQRQLKEADVLERFEVSLDMLRYRRGITGVDIQLRRAGKYQRS